MNQHIQLIYEALNGATLKGVFNLTDAKNINQAFEEIVSYINNKEEITKDLVRHRDGWISKSVLDYLENMNVKTNKLSDSKNR